MPGPTIEPSFDAFQATHNAGKPQLVWCNLVSDLETPVSAWLKLARISRMRSCWNPLRVARSVGGIRFLVYRRI